MRGMLKAAAALIVPLGAVFMTFAKFGLLSFGGGYVLVPLYIDEFVGPDAPLLQLPAHEFGDLLAISQMTPGPISVNAATFFGMRAAGIPGAVAATAGLVIPSFALMVLALRSLDRWRESPVARGLLQGVAPMTIALMLVALVSFLDMSVFRGPVLRGWLAGEPAAVAGPCVRPFAVVLVAAAAWAVLRTRLGIVAIIFACAAAGAAVFPFAGN